MEPSAVTPRDPFAAPGHWYRANLHTHTSASDGLRSPREAATWYREHGYDVLAITDHNQLTPVGDLSAPGFLVLPGIEVHPGRCEAGEPYHLVGLGVSRAHCFHSDDRVQDAIDDLRGDGAVVWLGHPYWAGLTLAEMVVLEGVIGLELYNSTCARFGKGLATVHWDDLLARGHLPWGLAVDDTHWEGRDWGQAWVMIKAEELAPEAIHEALATGSFYASQGPEIYDVRVTPEEVYVRCSPAAAITCVSLCGRGEYALAEAPDRLLTEAHIPRRHQRVYVRIECTDRLGRTAWSQPVLL